MKRWHTSLLLTLAKTRFAALRHRLRYSHHNHDVHVLFRKQDTWLPQGINSLIQGTYSPNFIKRYYFKDDVVDQLTLADRVLQHVLVKIIKPTLKHVINPNVYHFLGPSGVKTATKRIREILETKKPTFFIRADIKAFYKSIPHFKLIQDIKKHYDDPKLIAMLEEIITNPIDTPRGFQNPIQGIPIRGPLSPFFSGIYLKPLDDAFSKMQLDYFRYQDDILILCKSKRQQLRARRRLMEILYERRLTLSRKKTRMGAIGSSFHFLGIAYTFSTRTEKNTSEKNLGAATVPPFSSALVVADGENVEGVSQNPLTLHMTLHPRSLRNARENIIWMVKHGLPAERIIQYVRHWRRWWGCFIPSRGDAREIVVGRIG